MYRRNYVPSVADTMSVFSGVSVHGSIHGPGAQQPIQIEPRQPMKQFQPRMIKPPLPKQMP